jgi:DnaK suppressor protein
MPALQGFRAKLLTQRRELFRQAAKTEEDLLWLETDVEPEAMERGQAETMVRLLDRLDERAKREIEAIDLALTRIEAGSYGRCEGCGKDIPVARLEALPTATTCLPCSEASEAVKR